MTGRDEPVGRGNGDGVDVITGGAGFIGSHLVDRLLAQGRRVRVIDNFATGQARNLGQHGGESRLEVCELDVRDRAAVAEAIVGAERVFHLAALADIVPSIERPDEYHDVNVGYPERARGGL